MQTDDNGTCLTVTDFYDDVFVVEMIPETLSKTSFGKSIPPKVNLEKAMGTKDLFEGHVVQGHVDEVVKIINTNKDGKWPTFQLSYSPEFARYLVNKGSVTLDGVSLTIVEVTKEWFSVSLIPHTMVNTMFGEAKPGDFVNVEYDILSKLINRRLDLEKEN